MNPEDYSNLMTLPDGSILGQCGKYSSLRGTNIYYEIHGEGKPLVLMHRALVPIESFVAQVSILSKHFMLIIPERRGHGRSPDTKGDLSYKQSADDMAALLSNLKIDKAHLVGWCDGANIAMIMAIYYPKLIDKIVSISGNISHKGYTKDFIDAFVNLMPETIDKDILSLYRLTSPDGPDHFSVILEKVKRMVLSQPNLKNNQLHKITKEVLVMSGDNDVVSLDHTIQIYKSLPKAHLCIIPGSSEMLPIQKLEIVNQIIVDFLNKPVNKNINNDYYRMFS